MLIPSRRFGDRAYWLVTRSWFGFGLSAIAAVVAILVVGVGREDTHPHADSIAVVPAVASLAFFVVGLAAMKVRRT